MTNRETPDRRTQIRRVLAEADGFGFASLEPHDYQRHADAILALFEPDLLRAQAEAYQYRTALEGVARKAAVSVPPPAPRAVWREAAVFVEAMNEACDSKRPCESCTTREDVADALRLVADVPVPPPAPRADDLRLADQLVERCPDHGCVEPEWADGCHCEIVPLLRRLADEAQQPESEAEPTAEEIARANVLALHQIGEQLAGIELWMWEHLADVRETAKAQPEERPRCPRCQMPHDLTPSMELACASIRASIADHHPAVSGPVAGEQQNETPEAEQPARPECAHCWREIENRGTPNMGGPQHDNWVHIPGGFEPCFPQRGADSPRAEPRTVEGPE